MRIFALSDLHVDFEENWEGQSYIPSGIPRGRADCGG